MQYQVAAALRKEQQLRRFTKALIVRNKMRATENRASTREYLEHTLRPARRSETKERDGYCLPTSTFRRGSAGSGGVRTLRPNNGSRRRRGERHSNLKTCIGRAATVKRISRAPAVNKFFTVNGDHFTGGRFIGIWLAKFRSIQSASYPRSSSPGSRERVRSPWNKARRNVRSGDALLAGDNALSFLRSLHIGQSAV